ncbi:MAG: hypothetical protein WD771_08930 [Gemmatimonadaceae bacterium]
MDEDILAIGGFFFTVIVLGLGIPLGVPLVRSWVKRREMTPPPQQAAIGERLARMEVALESMAVEIERISEGQRFVTRLLAERDQSRAALPPERP